MIIIILSLFGIKDMKMIILLLKKFIFSSLLLDLSDIFLSLNLKLLDIMAFMLLRNINYMILVKNWLIVLNYQLSNLLIDDNYYLWEPLTLIL